MTTIQHQARQESEHRCVALWRFGQLLRAGFDRRSAAAIARRRDVDLHVAVELAAMGCPIETALKIVL
jgi:hypothetical protein